MGFLINILSRYAPWIYAICGLIALYHLYKVWGVRAERRQAIFSLERQKAMQDLYHIFFVCITLLAVMGLTYFSSTVLARAVDPLVVSSLEPAPTPLNGLPTPSPTPLPVTPTSPAPAGVLGADGEAITDTLTVGEASELTDTPDVSAGSTLTGASTEVEVPTPAPVEEPTATPEPAEPPAASAGVAPACPDERAVITSPGTGATVTGGVTVNGTAVHEQFQYYKVEYAPGTDTRDGFVYLAGGNNPVNGGVLANFDSNALTNGTWTLRIVVVDTTGNFPEPCYINITVQN